LLEGQAVVAQPQAITHQVAVAQVDTKHQLH
jgi:hypothetical protein